MKKSEANHEYFSESNIIPRIICESFQTVDQPYRPFLAAMGFQVTGGSIRRASSAASKLPCLSMAPVENKNTQDYLPAN